MIQKINLLRCNMRKLSELRKELEAKNRGRRIRIREKYLKERDNINKLDDS